MIAPKHHQGTITNNHVSDALSYINNVDGSQKVSVKITNLGDLRGGQRIDELLE